MIYQVFRRLQDICDIITQNLKFELKKKYGKKYY